MSNSSCNPAIDHTGSGHVRIQGPVDSVGQIKDQAVHTIESHGMQHGLDPYPDPFGDITFVQPPFSDTFYDLPGNVQLTSSMSCVPWGWQYPVNEPCTRALRPGVYPRGIKVTGGTWSFAPGVYVLRGGGLEITGGNVSGNGVFFYNTSGPGAPDSVKITTTGNITLIPIPHSHDGVPGNMLFFQDRALTATNEDFSITANPNTNIQGTMYVPSNLASITGGGGVAVQGQVIASRVKLAGNAGVTVNYDPNLVASLGGATLVE
jgi:hypothetical protein